MKTYLFAFLIGFNYLLSAQETIELFKIPTNAQVVASVLFLHQVGEVNYPKVFKGDFCFRIWQTRLIDSLAIPKGISQLNKSINLFSLLKIDLESNLDTIQDRMRKFTASLPRNFVLSTYDFNRNAENCLNIIYSPVFANRLLTAHLTFPEAGNFEFGECFILFILDHKGDITYFLVYDKFGNRAW